jgi:DNA mismatch endonuclease (patch repair protein)
MPELMELDEEKVIKLYHQLKSANKVSKHFNCSVTPIFRVLTKNQIERYGFQGLSGKDNSNYGNRWNEKQRDNLRKQKKGITWEMKYGKEEAERRKRELSDKSKGENNPFYGKHHTKKVREIARKSSSRLYVEKFGLKKAKEMKLEKSRRSKEIWKNEEFKLNQGKKVSEFYKNNPNAYTEERRQGQRDRIIKRMKNGEMPTSNSSIEIKLDEEMKKRKIKFINGYQLGKFLFDFAIPKKRILIEADGDYFHYNTKVCKKNPNKMQLQKIKIDKRKKEFAKKNNWKLLRFWEQNIKKDVKSCVDKIEEEIKKCK